MGLVVEVACNMLSNASTCMIDIFVWRIMTMDVQQLFTAGLWINLTLFWWKCRAMLPAGTDPSFRELHKMQLIFFSSFSFLQFSLSLSLQLVFILKRLKPGWDRLSLLYLILSVKPIQLQFTVSNPPWVTFTASRSCRILSTFDSVIYRLNYNPGLLWHHNKNVKSTSN